MGLSIRSVSIGVMMSGTLVTVILCLALAVQITDRALGSTNEEHEESFKGCLEDGEHRLVEMTDALLAETCLSVSTSIHGFLEEVVDTYREMVAIFSSANASDIGTFALYDKRRAVIAAAYQIKKIVLLATLSMDSGGIVVSQFDPVIYDRGDSEVVDFATVFRPPNATAMSEFRGKVNSIGTMKPDGEIYSDVPCVRQFWEKGRASGSCSLPPHVAEYRMLKQYKKSDGKERVWSNNVDPNTMTHAVWSHVYRQGSIAGLALRGVWTVPHAPYFNTEPAGFISVGHDLMSVKFVLDSITEREIIFVVIGTNGKRKPETGMLIGTTHGNQTYETMLPNAATGELKLVTVPLHCLNSTHEIPRGACELLFGNETEGDPFAPAYARQEISGTQRMTLETENDTEVDYFLRLHPMSDRFGLRWWIVLLEEVDHILATIIKKRAAAAVAAELANQSIQDQLEKDRILMYVWIVVVVALVLIASGFGTLAMTRPLDQLMRDMEEVAMMHLDVVDVNRQKSMIKEVHSMQKSFHVMIKNMKEFKQFMPAVLLREEDENDVADDDSAVSEDFHTPVHRRHSQTTSESKGGSTYQKKRGRDTDTDVSSKQGTGSCSAVARQAKQKTLMSVSLTRKQRSAYVCAGCRDFARLVKLMSDCPAIVEFHSAWLHACIADAQDWRGSVVGFKADRVEVSFGGLSACISPATKAAKYALKMRGRFAAMHTEHLLRSQALVQSGCSLPAVGIASGSVFGGNLGCQGLKAPAVLGRAAQHSTVMQAIACEIGLDIVIDQMSVDELKGVMVCTPVDVVRLETGKMQIAYYLSEAMSAAAGEWMYTMDAGVGEGESYDKAWGMLRSGDVSAAAELFQSMKDSDTALAVGARLARYVDDVSAVTGKVPNTYCRLHRKRSTVPGVIADSTDAAWRASMGQHRPRMHKNASLRSLSSRTSSRQKSAKGPQTLGAPQC
ncbi:hypothetical protein DIPPA_28915 [Diplonema papillatum]|nr:hypothetical protein DIPPA_28915 [Diplonema papillatum]